MYYCSNVIGDIMSEKQFVLEKARPLRMVLIAIVIGGVALFLIDYLFAGIAPFLGFILAAVVIYLFTRR